MTSEYPTCKICGAKMTAFDGVACYTYPKCSDSVRIEDDSEDWFDDFFGRGKKTSFRLRLADFCRGGDLSEV